jgi:hypothetical protein
MDERCLQCDHPKVGHFGSGCNRTSFLRGGCDCDFVEPPALPLTATAEQHRERAAWWSRRIDLTDRRMWRAPHGSDLWLRLDRLRKVADLARHHHLEMAQDLSAPAPIEPDPPVGPDEAGDDLLDLISIWSIERQPASTLELLLELVDGAPPPAQEAVRSRLEAEFDTLEPRHRRALLEDDAIRGLLTRLGVVSVRTW